jgi:hypothetical protein
MNICLNTYALLNSGFVNVKWFSIVDHEEAVKHIKELQDQQLPEYAGDYEIYYGDTEDDDLGLTELCDFDFQKIAELYDVYDSLNEHEQISVRWLLNEHNFNTEQALDDYDKVICYPQSEKMDIIYDMLENGEFGDIPQNMYAYLDFEALAADYLDEYQEYQGHLLHYVG